MYNGLYKYSTVSQHLTPVYHYTFCNDYVLVKVALCYEFIDQIFNLGY